MRLELKPSIAISDPSYTRCFARPLTKSFDKPEVFTNLRSFADPVHNFGNIATKVEALAALNA